MVTVAVSGLPTITQVGGSEDGSIARLKFSSVSSTSSSVIGTLNDALVPPALNVVEYGPES